MYGRAVRISVTLPEELYHDFERTASLSGYKKRSKAVGDAIKKFVTEYKALHSIKAGSCAGTITYTYKHHIRGITDALTDIQHDYSCIISAALHVHLDRENCLETLAVRGKIEAVRQLIQKLKTMKTESVQYVLLPQ